MSELQSSTQLQGLRFDELPCPCHPLGFLPPVYKHTKLQYCSPLTRGQTRLPKSNSPSLQSESMFTDTSLKMASKSLHRCFPNDEPKTVPSQSVPRHKSLPIKRQIRSVEQNDWYSYLCAGDRACLQRMNPRFFQTTWCLNLARVRAQVSRLVECWTAMFLPCISRSHTFHYSMYP